MTHVAGRFLDTIMDTVGGPDSWHQHSMPLMVSGAIGIITNLGFSRVMDPVMTHGSSTGPEDTMAPVAVQPSAPAWTEDADCDFGDTMGHRCHFF